MEDLTARYFEALSRTGLYPNAGNLRFYTGFLFAGVRLRGACVLDVGAGTGLFGIYAACAGAHLVDCLEPGAAGSTSKARARFEEIGSALHLTGVRLSHATFQEFEAGAQKYDTILMHNSVNHLDEQSCIRLHDDQAARDVYRRIFRKLADLAAPEATLLVCDCARRNFFGDLGLTNPVARSIEWHKHQSPRLWAQLLGEAGFRAPRIRWTSLNTLRGFGRLLLGNRVGAYFQASHFCLTMRR